MWCCANCDYLDKNRIQFDENHYSYRYGCNYDYASEGRISSGFICGWILKDNQLKQMGCSDFKHTEIEQTRLF